jgi:hypothetical protein
MVKLIDIKAIETLVINAHFQAANFEKDPSNTNARDKFQSLV